MNEHNIQHAVLAMAPGRKTIIISVPRSLWQSIKIRYLPWLARFFPTKYNHHTTLRGVEITGMEINADNDTGTIRLTVKGTGRGAE